MKPPRCTPFPLAARYARKVVRSLDYDGETLRVEITGAGFGVARVIFHQPAGFRVLDERDLCEFWNRYSEPNGWLYLVEEGGWLELERHRRFFNAPEFFPDLREYLIVDDKCLNVLTATPPEIVDLGIASGSSVS